MAYSYNGIFVLHGKFKIQNSFIQKNKLYFVKCKWKSHKHDDEQGKSDIKEYILYNSVYRINKTDKIIYGGSSQIIFRR